MIGEFGIPIGLVLALLLIYEFKPEENKAENSSFENKEDGLMSKEEKNENLNNTEDKENDKDIDLKKKIIKKT